MRDCQSGGRSVIAEVASKINEHYFYVGAHKTIYEMLITLWRANRPLDLISFTEFLRGKHVLESIGGAAYVTNLQIYIDQVTNFVPTAANLGYYLDIVVEKFARREIISDATSLVRGAYGDDAEDFSSRVQRLTSRIAHLGSAGSNGYEQFELDRLRAFNPKGDPDCLVGHRWLNRGGAALWAGGSGYGKSSLEMQLAIYWANGASCFGLRPVRALKSLIIQAENDEGDTAEQFQGVLAGIESAGDLDIDRDRIDRNIIIYRVIGKTGGEFLASLDTLLQIDRPDLVWIDPLFAFAGCDLLSSEKTGRFLREGLFPIAHERRVCVNVLHHIGKPPRDPALADGNMHELDYQYLGFGTSEIQNAFRAVNILMPVKKGSFFKLVLSKRGERAGAKDIAGEWSRELFIEHSRSGICWLQRAAESEIEGTSDKFSKEDLMLQMSYDEPLKTDTVYKRCYREVNAKRTSFYKFWGELKRENLIKKQGEGWILTANRPRTDSEPASYQAHTDEREPSELPNEPEYGDNADLL